MNHRGLLACIGSIIFWVIPSLLFSQLLKIAPESPQYGQIITFQYTTPRDDRSLMHVNLIVFKQLSLQPDTLTMSYENSQWTVSTHIQDSTVSMLWFHLQGIDSLGSIQMQRHDGPSLLFLYTANGLPVRGAYFNKALLYSGYGNFRNPDLKTANEAIEQELKLYPDQYQARLLKYTLLLQLEGFSNPVIFTIREDIGKTLVQEKESLESLRFALKAYEMIEDDEEIRKIQEKLIQADPDNQQAAMMFNEIMSLDNTQEQATELEKFLEKYPDNRLGEIALSQLASTLIELDDSTAMLNTGERLFQKASTMAGASGLSALAGVLAEKQWQLERAQIFIERALEIINAVNPQHHPPEISEAEWQERIRYTTARYQGIAGWILYHQKNFQMALQLLETAAEEATEPGILYHLAETQSALGNEEQAIATYARVTAFGGMTAELAKARLDTIWQKTNRNPEQLESLLASEENHVENAYIDKILQRRNMRPAPAFTMKRLNGGNLKLSDVSGEKVLLCFWATWSDASARILEILEDVYYSRDDVLILFVAVDKNASDISRYVRDNRVRFQVLQINPQVEQDYGLQGVPVLFVIDTQGIIHFQHKGYRPDMVEILHIELDNLD